MRSQGDLRKKAARPTRDTKPVKRVTVYLRMCMRTIKATQAATLGPRPQPRVENRSFWPAEDKTNDSSRERTAKWTKSTNLRAPTRATAKNRKEWPRVLRTIDVFVRRGTKTRDSSQASNAALPRRIKTHWPRRNLQTRSCLRFNRAF